MGIDDLLRQMQEDERADRLAVHTLATPIEYARSRGITPQKVYGSLRNGKLDWHECNCGGRRINIEEADALYGFKKEEDVLPVPEESEPDWYNDPDQEDEYVREDSDER